MPNKPSGAMSKHKRSFRKRRDYLIEKQKEYLADKGKPSGYYLEEINALDWAIATIEQIQEEARIAWLEKDVL
jgi:hypothetical protein